MHDTGVTSDAEIPAPDAEIASLVAAAVVPASDLSSSVPVEIPSSTEEAEKGAIGDEFESDSYIDPEEERMFDEGLTPVEVRTDGTSHLIVIPLDCNLMTSMESVVPALVTICSSVEHKTLESFKDADLSGLALWVSYFFCCPFFFFVPY